MLHVLQQSHLARVMFPVGELTKTQVREVAQARGLTVAAKQESQDLCFLNDGDYRRFLRQHGDRPPQPGPILDAAGHELGRHEGLPFYTIGQRKGLGLSSAEPLFVLRKDAAGNALIVGPRAALGAPTLIAHGVNWIAGGAPAKPMPAQVKIRYKATPASAVVTPLAGDQVRVAFDEPAVGATPGQAAVFYDGDLCLGGGTIGEVETPGQATDHIALELMPA